MQTNDFNNSPNSPDQKKTVARFLLTMIVAVGFLITTGFGAMIIRVLIGVQYTEITDPAQYGQYIGTNNDVFTRQFINSFFPDRLDESFAIVKYSYKAEDVDDYGFEAYLEFTIDDPDQFNAFISQIGSEGQWTEFYFDDNYRECTFDNVLDIYADNNDEHYQIEQAKIRKVLYCEETRTVIFVAIGVYEGGGIDTGYLTAFFNRFKIDPIVYEQLADTPYGVDPYEID